MKSYKLLYILLIGISCLFTACDGMNDLHIGYLEEGERIYAAKVDSISPGPGNERINMDVFINAQRIDFIRIYWNSYQDSTDYEIGGKTGIFNVLLENLPEREYLFQVVSFDQYGNRSLPFECTSLSYGENYRSTLANRRIESITRTEEEKAVFQWSIVAEDAISTELTYTDIHGKSIRRTISATTELDTIADFKPNTSFSYYTVYRPVPNSPDTFDTDKDTGVMPE